MNGLSQPTTTDFRSESFGGKDRCRENYPSIISMVFIKQMLYEMPTLNNSNE